MITIDFKQNAVRLLVFAGFFILNAACATGPMTNGYTARTLGKGNMSVDLLATGYRASKDTNVAIVPSARASFGVSDQLDLSFHTELKTYGLMAKYALIDKKEDDGLSLALLGSVYGGGKQSVVFGGIVASYRVAQSFEPYLIARYNRIRLDPAEFDAKYFPNGTSGIFDFFLGTAGFKYWIREDTAIGTEISYASIEAMDPNEFFVVHTTILF